MANAFPGIDIHLDILRDDLIHPLVSGNKWRKLKYFIEEVLQNNSGPVVTFGGAYSNHLVATACAGSSFNIPTHGFIRGDEERELNLYENTCIQHGMTIEHVSRTDYRDKKKLFDTYKETHAKAVFLDEGGDHPLALRGCSEILDELEKTYHHIILAAGTGTTMEGLVKGVVERKLETHITGISVLKNNFDLDRRLEKYPSSCWTLFHDYHRGKYARMDDELMSFIKDFYTHTSIKLDPVYTGKMMMAVKNLYEKGFLNSTQQILVVHTGGLLAFPSSPEV